VLQHLQATAAPDQTRPILDSAAEKGSVIIGIASIIDGDTIEIHGHRIRLFGVDAPESRQLWSLNGRKYRCGQRAAFALSDFLGQHTVSCKGHRPLRPCRRHLLSRPSGRGCLGGEPWLCARLPQVLTHLCAGGRKRRGGQGRRTMLRTVNG